MNYSDSARIRAVLTNCGFTRSENEDNADIIIFDTCSVRQKSEDKVTGRLKELSKTKKIWITGCMIQHNFRNNKTKKVSEQFKRGNFLGSIQTKEPTILGYDNEEIKTYKPKSGEEIVFINHAFNPTFFNIAEKSPNIELFFRIDDTGFLPLILQKIGYKNLTYENEIINEYEKIIPNQGTSMNSHTTTAYVPISSGCNQFCAYCIVPFARGLEKHLPKENIIKEIKTHLQNGVEEITLLGQIVNKHPEFLEIIKEALSLSKLKRLRYTSPYPTYYSEELLKLHETESKLCPHIHIPLQSGSTEVLQKMFRGYTASQAYECIEKIHSLKRKISITTDFIVGFPGETEKDFEETLKLVEFAKFDMIYIGIYSNRPGTFADKRYPDDIPYKTKQQRRSKLNALLKKISKENNQKEIGTTKTMLVNEIGEDYTLYGYTENMKQVSITKENQIEEKERKIGEFIPIQIIDGAPFKLIGKMNNEKE